QRMSTILACPVPALPGARSRHGSHPRPRTGLPILRARAVSCHSGQMRLAVPTEVKNNEYRVAVTPVGVHELIRRGHEVLVQRGAGEGSSIPDEDYVAQGATLVDGAEDTW